MEGLGINLQQFLFQLANFLVLFFGLTYLLHKPLMKLLDDRTKEIDESLKAAETMKKEQAAFEERQKDLLEKAYKEAKGILEETKQEAKQLETKLQKEAQDKADKLLAAANQQITEEHDRMKRELKEEVATLVVKASEKILEAELPAEATAKQARKLVETLS